MSTVLGDKLNAAKEAKNNDIKSFVWKYPKEDLNGKKYQREIKMLDASKEELQLFYNQCNSMLRTTDKEHPGRYILLDIIHKQREKCNAELYLRYLEKEDVNKIRYPRLNYLQDLKTALHKEENEKNCPKEVWNQIPIKLLTNGIPAEFENIPLSTVIDGCLDGLGRFDKSHITLNFIVKLGVWFKPKELKELLKKDSEGKTIDRLQVAREELGLKDSIKLHVNPNTGLDFKELSAMIRLKSKKYSELTTDQLTVLCNKILFKLADEVEFHITQWKTRIKQIQKVAKYKGFELNYHPDDVDE